MRQLPNTADLASLIASLDDHPDFQKLKHLAISAQRAQSCVADLSLAETSMEALAQASQVDAMRVTPFHLITIQHALVANAVVLYARATSTHSDGGERGSVSIGDRLAADQFVDHSILLDLRNKVIAHVHSEEAIDQNVWHRERMILREVEGAWLPGCVTRRMQVDEGIVGRLRRMIPVARDLVRETFYKRIYNVAAMLNEIGVEYDEFAKHPFDSVAFFGSHEAALHALTPGPGGSAMGMAR